MPKITETFTAAAATSSGLYAGLTIVTLYSDDSYRLQNIVEQPLKSCCTDSEGNITEEDLNVRKKTIHYFCHSCGCEQTVKYKITNSRTCTKWERHN